jgi:hypothetical protein
LSLFQGAPPRCGRSVGQRHRQHTTLFEDCTGTEVGASAKVKDHRIGSVRCYRGSTCTALLNDGRCGWTNPHNDDKVVRTSGVPGSARLDRSNRAAPSTPGAGTAAQRKTDRNQCDRQHPWTSPWGWFEASNDGASRTYVHRLSNANRMSRTDDDRPNRRDSTVTASLFLGGHGHISARQQNAPPRFTNSLRSKAPTWGGKVAYAGRATGGGQEGVEPNNRDWNDSGPSVTKRSRFHEK